MKYFRAVKDAMKDNQFDGWIGLDPHVLKAQSNLNQGISQYVAKTIEGNGSGHQEKS